MCSASAVMTCKAADPARGVLGDGPRQQLGQPGVDLHGRDRGDRVQQAKRERAEARPDLEHVVGRSQISGGDDAPDGVAVMHEVLTERFGRTEVEFVGEPTDLGGTEQAHRLTIGHPSILTRSAVRR